MSLTEAGERLVGTAAPRIEEIEAELAAVSELREKPSGTIRITATEYATNTILLPKLAKLLREYPDIDVEIVIDYGLTDIVAQRVVGAYAVSRSQRRRNPHCGCRHQSTPAPRPCDVIEIAFALPNIRTVVADAGHESRKPGRELKRHDGYELQIVKRQQRVFKVAGLPWIVERSFAWLGRYRRLSKEYEFRVQSSEAMIDSAATRIILNRIAPT